MIILGIETTCDETGVGIVQDGRKILANVVASSASMHDKYGGIVPEVAAREQVKVIVPALAESLRNSGCTFDDIDAIAVADGPGLIGSLLIGVESAKVLSVVFGKPLITVNHLAAHVYANWLASNPKPNFPLVALIVSGGHTDLILMKGHNKFQWLGGTLDDAAGEAFDKVARILGFKYPGGPEIERAAQQLTPDNLPLTFNFPRPMIHEDNFDFSFSGLKTSVVNYVNSLSTIENRDEIAYEFQEAVIDLLISKTLKAASRFGVKSIVVGGGVAANSELKNRMEKKGKDSGYDVFFPPKNLSVDNGAMIATAAFFKKIKSNPLKVSANPGLFF